MSKKNQEKEEETRQNQRDEAIIRTTSWTEISRLFSIRDNVYNFQAWNGGVVNWRCSCNHNNENEKSTFEDPRLF